ncbi:hypothetical protein M5X11_15990 [Paenibacillus alginolyticus]|uniref:hypothetical protein n=1 Tax=Paenibacillus alginolyticus TaxID=59839 RepID=UPI0004216667|nr:hypothetical protein [Paenibacillus alginolyticus]MCY9666445.1 hypothetical protein [Paenibacillus alginolyticus]
MPQSSERRDGKRIEVVEYTKFQYLPHELDIAAVEAYIKALNINYDRNLRIVEKTGIKQIRLTNHARQRWDSRVGPTNVSNGDLMELISTMCFRLGRIELLSKDCGLIDNDIVFFYEKVEDQMNIITFYGRMSQRPALADVKQLKLFNYRELDDVNFELQSDELDVQILPPIPYKRMVYKGTFVLYCLDAYDNQKEVVFHLTETSPKSTNDIVFRIEDEGIKHSKSTITALRMMRY